MSKNIHSIFIVSFLMNFNTYGQKTNPYFIDSTIKMQVDKNIKSVDFPVTSSMKFVMLSDDGRDQGNFGADARGQNDAARACHRGD